MIIIPGFTSDDKVPGVVAKNDWGAGQQSIGSIPLACVLMGNKTSGGSAALNQRYPISTPEEADSLFGARSELGRMLAAGLDVSRSALLYGLAVEEVSGGTAAILTFDITGSWTTAGEITVQLDEEVIRVAVAASHTPTTFGDAFEDAVNQAQNGRLFCTAVNTAGRVVLTVANLGARGNQHVAFLDSSLKPSGMVVKFDQLSDVVKVGGGPSITVAGTDDEDATWVATIVTGGINGTATFTLTKNAVATATAVTVPATPFTYAVPGTIDMVITWASGTHVSGNTHTWSSTGTLANGGVPFMGGVGSDDVDDALDATESVTNDYIGAAHNDVTNVGKIEAKVNAKAAFDVGRLEQYVVARTRGLTDAISLGQAGMNDQLGTCAWVQNHVEHPSLVAARLAVHFAVTDGAQPNTNYDDDVLPGAAPQFRDADVPNRSSLKSALNNGITPLVTVNGKLQIVCAICSRSLNGSTPDYRTFDHGDVAVPIRIRKELVSLGQSLKAKTGGGNQWAGPDVEEGLPQQGTMTPRFWRDQVEAKLQLWEGSDFNWLTEVSSNLPQAEWQAGPPGRIMSIVPTVVKPKFHQLGLIVRQTAAA